MHGNKWEIEWQSTSGPHSISIQPNNQHYFLSPYFHSHSPLFSYDKQRVSKYITHNSGKHKAIVQAPYNHIDTTRCR